MIEITNTNTVVPPESVTKEVKAVKEHHAWRGRLLPVLCLLLGVAALSLLAMPQDHESSAVAAHSLKHRPSELRRSDHSKRFDDSNKGESASAISEKASTGLRGSDSGSAASNEASSSQDPNPDSGSQEIQAENGSSEDEQSLVEEESGSDDSEETEQDMVEYSTGR